MAKKKAANPKSAEGRSKQAIIVEVYKANPDMSARDAVAKIKAEYGVVVKENYYQVTTSNYRQGKIDDKGRATGKDQSSTRRKAKKTARKKKARLPIANNGDLSKQTLSAAKEFADQYESFEEAREALDRVSHFLDAADDSDSATEAIDFLESLMS